MHRKDFHKKCHIFFAEPACKFCTCVLGVRLHCFLFVIVVILSYPASFQRLKPVIRFPGDPSLLTHHASRLQLRDEGVRAGALQQGATRFLRLSSALIHRSASLTGPPAHIQDTQLQKFLLIVIQGICAEIFDQNERLIFDDLFQKWCFVFLDCKVGTCDCSALS